ncbi:MFS transporter [Alkalilacustris brevis]|uniref:MFS transporter n=1 Tax=Alkalilacustris brevis TaxID=2026338 RepID=UPI000E0D48E6|nr:MFS transporter [Alkalilacustris brevis]
MSAGTRLATFFGVLRVRNYGIYTAGNAISLIGTWVQRVALGWLTWELTGSAIWLGLIAFADLVPTIIFGPIAGAVADRVNRLTMTRISQSVACLAAAGLFVLAASGSATMAGLLALTAISGTAVAFNQPARLALISSLVPRAHLPAAVAMNSVTFNLARFVGPAVAGMTIVTLGVAAAFALNAASYLALLVALRWIRLDPDEPKPRRGNSLRADLVEGFRHVTTQPGLAALFALTLTAGLCARPVIELLPGFADAVFDAGAMGLAWLTSAVGVGAVLAGVWLGGVPQSSGLTRLLGLLSGATALALALFALSGTLALALPAMVLTGFAMSGTGILTQTMIHLSVEHGLRGRVLGMYGILHRGGPALGALVMGALADLFGLHIPVLLGAGLVLAMAIWILWRRRAIAAALALAPGRL